MIRYESVVVVMCSFMKLADSNERKSLIDDLMTTEFFFQFADFGVEQLLESCVLDRFWLRLGLFNRPRSGGLLVQ